MCDGRATLPILKHHLSPLLLVRVRLACMLCVLCALPPLPIASRLQRHSETSTTPALTAPRGLQPRLRLPPLSDFNRGAQVQFRAR
jgi:hypothetical protein